MWIQRYPLSALGTKPSREDITGDVATAILLMSRLELIFSKIRAIFIVVEI